MSQSSDKGNKKNRKSRSSKSKALSNVGVGTAIMRFQAFTPFPVKFRTKHRYAQTVTFTSGVAGIMGSQNVWALTGMYDPDITGVGHQPYGFDQMTPLYFRYLVEKVDVELLFNTLGGTTDACCAMVLRGSAGFTLTGMTVDNATEDPMIATKTLSPYGNSRSVAMRMNGLKPYILLGISKRQFEDNTDQYAGTSTTNPTVAPYLQASIGIYNGTAGVTVSCQVILTFHAIWFDRFNQAPS